MGPYIEFSSEISEVTGSLFAGSIFGSTVSGGVSIVLYVLMAFGLYTIAKRRGIKNAWMAWVPVVNMWILGCISDQYQYVAKGNVRYRRKVLLGLEIAQVVLKIAVFVCVISLLVGLIVNGADLETMSDAQALALLGGPLLAMLGICVAILIVAAVSAVFRYIACYDLFASSQPENKTLFLLLSIFVGVTLPILIFVCRDKDLGMPPRKSEMPPIIEE